jgi:hypothetical protein
MKRCHWSSRGALWVLSALLLGLVPPTGTAWAQQTFGFVGTVDDINPTDPNGPAVPQATLDKLAAQGVTVGEVMTGFLTIDPNTPNISGTSLYATYQAIDIAYRVGTKGFEVSGWANPSMTIVNNCIPGLTCFPATVTKSLDIFAMGGDNDPGGVNLPPTTSPPGLTPQSNLTGVSTLASEGVLTNNDIPASAPAFFPLPADPDVTAGWLITFIDSDNSFGVNIGGSFSELIDEVPPHPQQEAVPFLPLPGMIALFLGLGGSVGLYAQRRHRSRR